MIDIPSQPEITLWKPTPVQLPTEWLVFTEEQAQQALGLVRSYVLKVKNNAQHVGEMLRSWGLPWHVVIAGYLWEYDELQKSTANLKDANLVLNHISEAAFYAQCIESENWLPLLNPPYSDLGALLITVAIYYQALQTLKEQSYERPYTGVLQSQIENVGRILLNIATRLGMWYLKRDIEDLTEQLRRPRKFADAKLEHAHILERDADLLEDVRQLFMKTYQEATQKQMIVSYSKSSVSGMKRRLQDAHTTASSHKTELTAFDLVTFDITVPTIRDCYLVFGVLNQLGYIQDRVTEQIANPKPNGCSYIAMGLILKPQGHYTRYLKWPEGYTCICQLIITTPLLLAIAWYGCLHPSIYQLYMKTSRKEDLEPPSMERLLNSEGGKVFFTIMEDLIRAQPEARAPIVVYSKNYKSIALPKGSTALDFAYALDRITGEYAAEAFINNRQAPLYRTLEAGDIVEIRTSTEIQARDYWLHESYTKTSIARRYIKESLNQLSLDRRGYNLLRQQLERYHFMLTPEDLDQELHFLVKKYNLGTPQEYLEKLDIEGEGSNTPNWVAKEIMQQISERNESLSTLRDKSNWVPVLDMQLTANKKLFHRQQVCNYCQPTYPRDMKIIGRLRKRSGELFVHKASCPHLIDRSKNHRSTLLPMIWEPHPPAFQIGFFIISQDRSGLILDLTRMLRRHQCGLLSIKADAVSKFGEGRISFILEAYADKEVLDIWQALYRIESVTKAEIDAANTSASTRERLQNLREQHISLPIMTSIEPAWEESLAVLPSRSLLLKNPFDISRPATAKMFFGRSEETKMLQRELCDSESGKALLLSGPRRSGKSSICKNFLECHVRSPFWYVLFSLQNATEQTEETILMQLADEVCRKFNEQFQLPPSRWQQNNNSDPQVRFKRVVQDCIVQVPGSRLVLALDEFGGAVEAYERQILKHRFFTFWKDLMHEIPQISLILVMPTGAHTILNSRQFANAFSFTQHLPVLYLDTESAKQLLVDPLQDQNILIHPNTVALAVTLTGGNPYFMTLIGQQLVQQLNRYSNKQVVNDEDLRLVVEQFIQGGSSQNFVFLKRELQNDEELRILEEIIEFTSRTGQLEVQLKKIAMQLNLPFRAVRRHIHRLRNGLIIQENGPSANPYYSFTIELVRRWLVNNRWFFLGSV